MEATFWAQIGASLAILALLRYLEATAMLLGAKLGDLEGKLRYWEVMLKLSWAMLCYVEAICWTCQHVVGFASRKFLRAMFVGSSKATLWSRWCLLGANFGDFGAVLKATWAHFGPCCFGILKNNPKIHP